MKILQNETTNNNSTTTSFTTAAITATTTSATTISKDKYQHQQSQQNSSQSQQQQQQHTAEKRKAKTLKNKILQNVAQQQRQEQQQQQQQQQQQHRQQQQLQQQDDSVQNSKNHDTPTSAMTDERLKSNNNKNSANSNNSIAESKSTTKTITAAKNLVKDTENKDTANGNNSNDFIIAEAAKILLKNGLNGTNAAAVATATATLLTAAASFHHLPPTVAHSLSADENCNLATATSLSPTLTSSSVSNCPALGTNVTTAAAAAHAQLVAIAAAAAAVNATNHKRLAGAAASSCSTSSTTTLSSSSLSIPSCKSPNQHNNGLLDNSVIQKTSTTTVSAVTSAPSVATTPTDHFTKPYKSNSCKTTISSASSMDMGIIDYTVNSHNSSAAIATTSSSSSSASVINLSISGNSPHYTTNSAHHKFLPNNNNNSNNNNINSHINHSDIIRPPVSHQKPTNINSHKNALSGIGGGGGGSGLGGRLQFFKDGKFILELARSKDGEKGGWVSVPRKLFRTPSAATSSTVTPSATASTSAATIPSPLAASPAAVVGSGSSSYPKNECSNSLSFSDDNSSLQSSPWQRDHCWKQAAPRKNVSKKLTLFYRRPAFYKLTTQAVLLSHRKRRKPYDTNTLDNGLIFGLNIKKQIQQQQHEQQKVDKFMLNKKEVELNEEVDKATTKTTENKPERKDVEIIESSTTEDGEQEIKDAENKNSGAKEKKKKEECDKHFDNKHIKTEDFIKTDHDDVEMSKIPSPCKKEIKSIECSSIQEDTKKDEDEDEKMNTIDCTSEEATTKRATSFNGKVSKEEQQQGNASKVQVENMKKGDEEKRLKKCEHKTRAKLTAIVQKLMDASTSRLSATAHSFKTSNQTASTQSASLTFTTTSTISSSTGADGAKNQNSKVSPPSNNAASRLVEYHQQHVSPRKRILREFEKVSLEDSTTGVAGVKRSRAKNNNINSSSSAASSVNVLTSSTATSNKSMSLNAHNSNLGTVPKSSATSVTPNNPTKLYSSYSIHSLLGSGVSSPQPSSSSVTAMSPSTKRSTDFPATITSSTMAVLSPYHTSSFSSNLHSNNSPKSPERNSMVGGKSPSNSATKSKRSPPYSSPMRETHSRSPISSGIGGYNDYGGRKSPRSMPDPAHNAFNKMRYASSGGIAESTSSSTNHHLNHQQQQHHLHSHQNYHHQPQTYYSPYMVSPHYVPPLSGSSALSPNASSVNTQSSSSTSSRSPRHHTSAFRATTPTSTTFTTSTTHNIPSTQRGDLSPQRSTTSSPRETTPRTVPKKTASIRRQFASPTSTTQYHNNSNCSSPTTALESRSEDHQNNDRRTPVSSNTSHQQHQQPQSQPHLMQRGSPGNPNIAGSPIHPYSYMYAHPPNGGNSPHTSNATGSNLPSSSISPSTANASAAAAAAAAAASYIPAVVGSPYYHPYISTLAAMRHPQMWMQHYQNAVAAAANPTLMQSRHPAMLSAASVAARLSPPYHGFQYNGVGNAAAIAAAAAAAAAGFGSTPNPPHHSSNTLSHPSSMFNPMASSPLHGMQYSTTALQTAGLLPAAATAALTSVTAMTDTTDHSKSSKNNFPSTSTSLSTGVSCGVVGHSSLPSSTGSTENSMYTISNKDEQSSDVPLNLSKH